jgi:transcription-repair coupling factor (superfamily II helicase)
MQSRTDGRDVDYFHFEYAEDKHIYVPIERLDLIFKYAGPEPVGLDPV